MKKKGVFWCLNFQTGKKEWITEEMLKKAKPIVEGGIEIGFELEEENE